MASIDRYSLQKRFILKKAIVKTLKWIVLIGVVLLIDVYSSLPFDLLLWWYGAAIALIFILELIYQKLYFRRYYYDLLGKYVVIRNGVIARRERTLPYHRIHDVYVDQDILDRIFRLWDLHFTTVDSRASHIHIDGLNGKGTRSIRDFVLEKIS